VCVQIRQEIAATAKFEHAESSLIIQCPQHAERSQPPDSFARGPYEWTVPRLPYIIVHELDEDSDEVIVVGVFHGAQAR
jgi:hypothetical protein